MGATSDLGSLTTNGRYGRGGALFQAFPDWSTIQIIEEIDPKLEWLLNFLDDYPEEGTPLGKLLTAGRVSRYTGTRTHVCLGMRGTSSAIRCAVAPCSWTPQESQVKRCEHQDDANIHCQPFPESVSEDTKSTRTMTAAIATM
jgi:hypothetical protein